MRIVVVYSFLLLMHSYSMTQEFKLDASYKYMYSNQWDKAIQTYNFSRPFIAEKQPLFAHGLNSSLSFIFKSDKKLNYGINLSYSYFGSSAENENFDNVLNLHFLNIGYLIHYENKEKQKGLFYNLIISATSSGLFRNVNGEPFEYDETKSMEYGIGGDLNLKIGYYIKLKNKRYLSPFLAFGYTPYLFSPNYEKVINQTKGLSSKNWTGILMTQFGLTFQLRQQIND